MFNVPVLLIKYYKYEYVHSSNLFVLAWFSVVGCRYKLTYHCIKKTNITAKIKLRLGLCCLVPICCHLSQVIYIYNIYVYIFFVVYDLLK